MRSRKSFANVLWDAWCLLSLIGIWPRFIEPYCLQTTKIKLTIQSLPTSLHGLKIVQFGDLHWSLSFSQYFAQKILKKINLLAPDLILFTGDFLSYSILDDYEGLKSFLLSLKAKHGVYAILGNHDYEQFVSLTASGSYDIKDPFSKAAIHSGFERLFSSFPPSFNTTTRAKLLSPHKQLSQLISETSIQLLHNQSKLIAINDSFLNIAGTGEYLLEKNNAHETFKEYHLDYPGIVMTHNPDAVPSLLDWPGHLILAGHTHGAQVNLPWIRDKLTIMNHPEWYRGLHKIDDKWLYVTRGVGSVEPFRWCSVPELVEITLLSK